MDKFVSMNYLREIGFIFIVSVIKNLKKESIYPLDFNNLAHSSNPEELEQAITVISNFLLTELSTIFIFENSLNISFALCLIPLQIIKILLLLFILFRNISVDASFWPPTYYTNRNIFIFNIRFCKIP